MDRDSSTKVGWPRFGAEASWLDLSRLDAREPVTFHGTVLHRVAGRAYLFESSELVAITGGCKLRDSRGGEAFVYHPENDKAVLLTVAKDTVDGLQDYKLNCADNPKHC